MATKRRRRPMRLALTIPTPCQLEELAQLLEALGPDYAEAEVRAPNTAPLEVWKRPPLEPAQAVLGTFDVNEEDGLP